MKKQMTKFYFDLLKVYFDENKIDVPDFKTSFSNDCLHIYSGDLKFAELRIKTLGSIKQFFTGDNAHVFVKSGIFEDNLTLIQNNKKMGIKSNSDFLGIAEEIKKDYVKLGAVKHQENKILVDFMKEMQKEFDVEFDILIDKLFAGQLQDMKVFFKSDFGFSGFIGYEKNTLQLFLEDKDEKYSKSYYLPLREHSGDENDLEFQANIRNNLHVLKEFKKALKLFSENSNSNKYANK